jgi:hypothetical protein
LRQSLLSFYFQCFVARVMPFNACEKRKEQKQSACHRIAMLRQESLKGGHISNDSIERYHQPHTGCQFARCEKKQDRHQRINNRTKRSIADPTVPARDLGALLDLMGDGTLSGKLAKEVFEAMVETDEAPGAIVEKRGLRQVTDAGAIAGVVAEVLAKNADKVAEYRSGKDKLFGFFVGQVMKAMAGKGNPAAVNDAVKKALDA